MKVGLNPDSPYLRSIRPGSSHTPHAASEIVIYNTVSDHCIESPYVGLIYVEVCSVPLSSISL